MIMLPSRRWVRGFAGRGAIPSSYPNQPNGFTPILEYSAAGLPAASGPGVLVGAMNLQRSDAGVMYLDTDPTAPQSASGVLAAKWETGTPPGFTGNGKYLLWTGWDTDALYVQSVLPTDIYTSQWLKIPSANLEAQAVGMKFAGYWGVGYNNQSGPADAPGGPVQTYLSFMNQHEGGAGTSLETRFRVNAYTQGVESAVYEQNENLSTYFTCNAWMRVETVMRCNTIGQANGVWQVWLNGVRVINYATVTFRNALHPSGFYGVTWDPVWGGQTGTAKTRDDYLWLDHYYVSGAL